MVLLIACIRSVSAMKTVLDNNNFIIINNNSTEAKHQHGLLSIESRLSVNTVHILQHFIFFSNLLPKQINE